MATSVSVGDKVKAPRAEYDYTGKVHLASFVRYNTYDVIQVGGRNQPADRIVIGIGKAVTAAVKLADLDNITGTSTPMQPTPAPAPQTVVKETVINRISGGSDILAAKIKSNFNPTSMTFTAGKIEGSQVQRMADRFRTTRTNDYAYEINKIIASKESKQTTSSRIKAIETADPTIVQNNAPNPFPTKLGYNLKKNRYIYSYYQNYDEDKVVNNKVVASDMDNVRKSINTDVFYRSQLIKNYTTKYNKFKIDNPNDRLSKTFAHVFFVRPDCNIYVEGTSANRPDPQLIDSVGTLSEFYYANKHSPDILRQLTQSNAGYNHEFMLYPSNKARSFQIADEYITVDDYGRGLTGYKIPYGKDNVESRTAGKFSINYVDDRDLHMYNLHKLWIDYISYVFRGKLKPRDLYNLNKIIDYATCVYYILCAEDGETIIFWSKYWGVFPIEAPSSSFSYSLDNSGTMRDPELSIEYQYAWKEDFNPLSMIEFNMHSDSSSYKYINSYQPSKLGTGYTWAGVPFIETFNSGSLDLPYTFKLRFRPEPK